MRYGLTGLLLASVLAAVIALQNPQPAEVHFFVFESSGSAGLVLIVTFGIGVVVGLLGTLPSYLRRRRELKRLLEHSSPESSDETTSRKGPGLQEETSTTDTSTTDTSTMDTSTTGVRPEKDLPGENAFMEDTPAEDSPVEGSPMDDRPPPTVGSDPPSRMRRDSWWGALRERDPAQDKNDASSSSKS